MKNSRRRVLLIVAAILCGLGFGLLTVSFAAVGFDFQKLDTVDAVDGVYYADEAFDAILIDTDEADVRFAVSEDNRVKVLTHERSDLRHTVSVSDGKLVIRLKDKSWDEMLTDFYFGSQHITVLLPEEACHSLLVETDTGDVTLPEEIGFYDVNVETDTGDVKVFSHVTKMLTVKTDTGDIHIEKTDVSAILTETDTGDVKVVKTRVSGTIGIETETGDVTLKETVSQGDLYIKTDTGDVSLVRSDAANIDIKTDTGDVKGSLLSDKTFVVKTDSGDKKIPHHNSNGTWCKVVSDTGDVEFEVVGDS